MKKLDIVFVFILITFAAFAQRPKPPRTPPTSAEAKLADYNYQCVHRDTYTVAQRLKFYPFNKAAKVILVSFYGLISPNDAQDTAIGSYLHQMGFDTVGKIKFPFIEGRVDTSVLLERKTLTKAQVNKLTDVLYNIDVRAHYGLEVADPGGKCYNPRNAILFVDWRGKIFAEIVICFECQKIEVYPKKIKTGKWCDGKFTAIKNYFKSVGIRWGVTVKEQAHL